MLEKTVRFIQRIIGSGRKELVRTFDISTPCQPTIQFLVPLNGVWARVGEATATPSRLFDHYLDPETADEEVLAAAILVYGDNRPWNTTEHSEKLMHIEWWLSAVTSLLEGESSADIWAWEESGMKALRQGGLIILEERTHHCSFQLAPICFELGKFARELVKENQVAVEFIMGLKQIAQERYPAEWRSAQEARKAIRAMTLDPSSVQQVDHDQALAELRAFEREAMHRVTSPAYKLPPPPTNAEIRAERLAEVLDYLAAEVLVPSWEKLAAHIGFSKGM